jgi:hypothetical protein
MDHVELLVIARRAEAAYRGETFEEYVEANPDATDRLAAVLGAVCGYLTDGLTHMAQVGPDYRIDGLFWAADKLDDLRLELEN